jgi:hypothetical protein
MYTSLDVYRRIHAPVRESARKVHTTHLLETQTVRTMMLERQGPVDAKYQQVRAILAPSWFHGMTTTKKTMCLVLSPCFLPQYLATSGDTRGARLADTTGAHQPGFSPGFSACPPPRNLRTSYHTMPSDRVVEEVYNLRVTYPYGEVHNLDADHFRTAVDDASGRDNPVGRTSQGASEEKWFGGFFWFEWSLGAVLWGGGG